MTAEEAGIAFVAVLCSSAGQLCFKAASGKDKLRDSLFFLSLGVVLMLAGLPLVAFILQTVPLSSTAPIAALAYIITPLGAMFCFCERVHPSFWLGVLLIIFGIVLILCT